MYVGSAMTDTATMRLSSAILIYTREQQPSVGPDWDGDGIDDEEGMREAFATIHRVEMMGTRKISDKDFAAGELPPVPVHIQPGRCLTRKALEKLTRALVGGQGSVRQMLPANVLALEGGCLAWHVPAARRPIYFQSRDEKFNRRMNAKVVMHPALLFLAKPGGLWVWALDTNERPAADTWLFVAPYFNLYSGGHMCRGNAKYPEGVTVADIPAWEEAFFATQFTHSNYHSVKMTGHPKGHDGLWEECLKAKDAFPVQHLVPAMALVGGRPGKKPLTAGEAIGTL